MVRCVHPGRDECGTRGGRGASVCLRAIDIFLAGSVSAGIIGGSKSMGKHGEGPKDTTVSKLVEGAWCCTCFPAGRGFSLWRSSPATKGTSGVVTRAVAWRGRGMVVPTALPGVWSVACGILARRGLVWLVTLQAHVTEGTHRGRASHLVPTGTDGAGTFPPFGLGRHVPRLPIHSRSLFGLLIYSLHTLLC